LRTPRRRRRSDEEAQDAEGTDWATAPPTRTARPTTTRTAPSCSFAARLQPAVAGADGRGELGIVIDEGALDLLQQTLLVLGERHVDLQVGGAKAVGGSRRR
jgi:hypothetical protein